MTEYSSSRPIRISSDIKEKDRGIASPPLAASCAEASPHDIQYLRQETLTGAPLAPAPNRSRPTAFHLRGNSFEGVTSDVGKKMPFARELRICPFDPVGCYLF